LNFIILKKILLVCLFCAFFFLFSGLKSPLKEIQNFELSGNKGAVLLLDAQTGQTLFSYGGALLDQVFPAGSLIKPFLLLALDNLGHKVEKKPFFCSGFKSYEDLNKICWVQEGHKQVNLWQAMAYSCNSYFYEKIAKKLSFNALNKVLNQFQINQNFSKTPLSLQDFYKAAIGLDGVFQTTPRSILLAYMALLNGGMLFDKTGKKIAQINLPFLVLEDIKQGLRGAFLFGTASKLKDFKPIEEGLAKTGTGGVSWRITTGWLVLLWPTENPQYALMTLSRPGTGANQASQLALDFLKAYFH